MARRHGREHDEDDAVLDVIDLLADDTTPPGSRRAVEPGDETEPPSNRPRWLIVTLAVVLVGVIAAIVATRGNSHDDDAGISDAEAASEEETRSSPLEPRTIPFEAAAFGGVTGRFAMDVGDHIVVFDAPTRAAERVIGTTADTMLLGASASLLLTVGDVRVVTRPDGSERRVLGPFPVVPMPNGDWLAAQDASMSVLGGELHPVEIPAGFNVVAALHDRYLLQATVPGPLFTWTPGLEPEPLVPVDVLVLAVHPYRIAWSGPCPGDTCGLHVTDLTTRTEVMLPGVLDPSREGRAFGRFSPDARHLALAIAGTERDPATLVVIDLASGAVLYRDTLGLPLEGTAGDPYVALPFAFSGDSRYVLAASWNRYTRSLLVIDTANAAVRPTGSRAGRIESVAALDARPVAPTTALFDPSSALQQFQTGVVVALGRSVTNTLTLVDVDTGTARDIVVPRDDDAISNFVVVALRDGFAWLSDGQLWWIPTTGDAVPLGPAQNLIAGRDPTEAWAIASVDGGYDVTRIDGVTGTRGTPYRSMAPPYGAVNEGLVAGRPASFDRPAMLEIWDPATGRTRGVAVNAEFPVVTAAAGDVVIWYDQSCRAADGCPSGMTNVASGETTPLRFEEFNAFGASLAGTSLYMYDNEGLLRVVDLVTGETTSIPDVTEFESFAANENGIVVFQRGATLYTWRPGWSAPVPVATDVRGGADDIAVR